MMRYLEYDFLKDHGLQHFDNWVAVFGDQKTDWELKPAGNGFKERTRIANYTGLPELMSMFKQVADIRTADTLKLDVPDCDYQVVQVEATPFQQELVQELADRADAINAGNVDPTIDNMLKITSDGRKLGLDPRLIDTYLFNAGDTVYNAQNTSSDKIFVKGGERKEVNCWRDIWKEVITDQHGADNAEVRCYVSSDKDSPCNKAPIFGGHMLTTGSAEPGVGDTIYIIPICRSHNTHTNTKEMKITSQVYALKMKYKVDTVSPVDYPFVSVPDTNLLEDQDIVLNGIDVSVHNGRVDFQKVKNAGINFVILREGYGNDKVYKYQVDELFETNYTGAKNAGLNVGAYHYLYATSAEGARQEAEGFVDNLKGKQFEMPIALDIEDKCQSNLPTSVICEMVKAFMDICEGAGYYCVLYSYESFLTTKITSELLSRYDVWCANVSSPPHIKSYGMHQYSFTGRIAGVNTNVDLDHAYKDYPALIKSRHFNGF